MSRARVAAVMSGLALLAGGCGSDEEPAGDRGRQPLLSQSQSEEAASATLGFPEMATRNTTRVAAADPVATAAAVALATHPAAIESTRPAAVTLVERDDAATAISAAQLAGPEVRAPLLLVDGETLPAPSQAALDRLRPGGVPSADGVQAIRAGTPARPENLRSTNLEGDGPAALARAIDRLHTTVAGEPSRSVIVAPLDALAYAMPAAGWAAKSGDPVLWSHRDELPAETIEAIRARERPRIYVLGPPAAIGGEVVTRLQRLGEVTRVSGPEPIRNAIAFARFSDGDFGWGVTDPGHGIVLASADRPADAGAAAPLSAAGSYAPLLLLGPGGGLPTPVRDYLLDIRPGYESDPVRGVYNRAWLLGDMDTISVATQTRIDSLLEIQPVDPSS